MRDALPPVGSEVRATITDEGAIRLGRQTGRLAKIYDGRLAGVSDDSLHVSVVSFRVASGFAGTRQLRQSLAIATNEVETLATRRLSRWRSGTLAALGLLGVYFLIDQVAGSGGSPVGGGEPLGAMVPLVQIPVGR